MWPPPSPAAVGPTLVGSSASGGVSLSGGELLRLQAPAGSRGPAFMPGLQLWLGALRVNVSAGNISSDGRTLRVTAPPFSAVCGGQGQRCRGTAAYVPVLVLNPVRLANVSFPPSGNCSGRMPGNGQAVAGQLPCGAGVGGYSRTSQLSLALFYTSGCLDGGGAAAAAAQYKDPATGVCRRCPEGGVCPGGPRVRPRPGFWAASETDAVLLRCE